MLSKHSDSFDFRFVDPKIFHFLNSIFNQQKIKEAKILNKIEEMKIEHDFFSINKKSKKQKF